MKLLLTSAGLRNEAIINALEALLGKPLTSAKVLFLTTAANTGVDDKRWLLDNLNEFTKAGVASLDVLDIAGLPKEVWQPHFVHADILCVGGGDERYLAHVFAAQNMKEELTPFLTSKVYMGISAGSMVVGTLLPADLTKAIFIEEDFRTTGGEGLGFVPFAYVPHLNSSFFSLRKERLDRLQTQFDRPVYASDDETALMIVNGVVTKVGKGEILYYQGESSEA